MSENLPYTGPCQANLFHEGNTCPFCQEAVEQRQLIVTCNACGSIHHETCWHHHDGCASYHCDEQVRVAEENLQSELTITLSELEKVKVPPKPVRRSPEEAARAYLPPKPTKRSVLAMVSAVLGLISFVGMYGLFTEDVSILAGGIALCLAGLTTGVIALVLINSRKHISGFVPAGSGILLASILMLIYFGKLNAHSNKRHRVLAKELMAMNSMPTEAELGRMEPAKATALRANVVITSTGGAVLPTGAYGSGVILKLDDQRACILTNKHVLLEGKKSAIEVLFYNGEKSPARVEWEAPGTLDIAILSCQALTLKGFTPVPVLSQVAEQGKRVFAVGNPMELYWTYTEGVISGLRRQKQSDQSITIYQTQTPINYGNSGGGLYDMTGSLIGVNTWTKDKSVTEGLSFAISTQGILLLLGENPERFFANIVGRGKAEAEDAGEQKAETEAETPEGAAP